MGWQEIGDNSLPFALFGSVFFSHSIGGVHIWNVLGVHHQGSGTNL